MPMLNQLTVIGHLGKDPEQGTTKKGNTYTRLRIAVDQGVENTPLWLNVVCWNKLAQRIFKRLHKGSPVFVQGSLQMDTYTDKDGVQRQGMEVFATNIQVLEKQPVEEEPTPIETEEAAA